MGCVGVRGGELLFPGAFKGQQASVFPQTTTATRAPSLTRPRSNRRTVAAPAPPRTPPPPPTAKEATPRPSRALTVREVSRAHAGAEIRWRRGHFLFVAFLSRRLLPERVCVSRQEHPLVRDLGESTKCQEGRAVLGGEELFRQQSHSGTHAGPRARPLPEVRRRRAMILIGSRFSLQDLEEEAPASKKSKLESSSQDFEES